MKMKFFSTTAILALFYANSLLVPTADAAPEEPSGVEPADFSENADLNPVLEAVITDSSGTAIQKVDFNEGFTYDIASSDGITAFQKTTANDPVLADGNEGTIPFNATERTAIAFDDGESVITENDQGFPSHRFEVDVSKELAAGSKLELKWKGKALANGVINLAAWDYQAAKWVVLKQAQGNTEGNSIALSAEVDQAKFVNAGKIQAMVYDSGNTPNEVDDQFTMMWFTDTQFYTQDNPEVWESMTDWMIDEYNKGTYEYAFHTGDLVQNVLQEEEWAIADENLGRMDEANIPYGVIAGNHDVILNPGNPDYSYYWKYAGADRYENNPWYGGQMDNNRNHYDLFSFGEHDFIMLYLGYGKDGTPESIQWANEVLKKHADRNAIVALHLNLTPELTRGSAASDMVHRQIVLPNENVKMVLSGHYQGAARQVTNLKNADGTDRQVLEVLSNYQGGTKPEQRGQGYLRLLSFNPADETVDFVTYSPYLDDYDFFDPAQETFTEKFDLAGVDSSAGGTPAIDRQVETDYMAVDAYKNTPIGQAAGLQSGDIASVQWNGLKPEIQYFWYMNVTNANGEAKKSEIHRFKTGKAPEPAPDLDPPAAPTVNEVTDQSAEVPGIAEAGAVVTVKAGSTLLGTGTADSEGKFSIKISKQKAGTKISVTATDAAGNVSEAKEITVLDITVPAAPTVNEVTAQSAAVTGTTEAGGTVTVKAGSALLGSAIADSAGRFSVKIPLQKAGTALTVIVADKAGNVSKALQITVKGETSKEKNTSRLGHLKSANVRIYGSYSNQSEYKLAGNENADKVYYIKKQVTNPDGLYYLISLNPSSSSGVVGWVKASDLSTHPHQGVDKKAKTFYVKGNGSAFAKAWGGSKDIVYQDLSAMKNQQFKVHLTEKVGNNIWYRGVLGGQTVWLHSSFVSNLNESKTSKLGHIRNANVKIYPEFGNESTAITAGTNYTNAVYYIKKEAALNGQKYYLLSKNPSSTSGVVGWAKAGDISVHQHLGMDRKAKNFVLKGVGSAYSKAWGGSKDIVYSDLSAYKNQQFKVHLTEKVGNNVWYRGVLDGKTVWVHSSFVSNLNESKTSKLGHIRNANVKIYPELGKDSSTITAGSAYTNAVYYIKKEALLNGQKYYLLSKNPSSTSGVVGWAKAGDISVHQHLGMDRKAKNFVLKGVGSAYTKAWGGSKDMAYQNLSTYKNQQFKVHLTEKVGNNVWYRGVLNGQTVWVHSSFVK